MSALRPGERLRAALAAERPLQLVGTINSYCALMAERAGYRALYLSGAGVSNASYGLPDLGLTNLGDVLIDVRRITGITDLPLVVDVDTGWGAALGIARTVREMIGAGAAAIQIEDQVAEKRCGHRPNKAIVSLPEMADRIKAAVDARTDRDLMVIARTDALQREGLGCALDRAAAYVEAGADALFPEALSSLEEYRAFTERLPRIPVLANMTEFGVTPLFTLDELRRAGVSIALYPLSAFRAMNKAALEVYEAIRRDGHQKGVVVAMQTRDELYEILGYHEYERTLDKLFAREGDRPSPAVEEG
jgi:methylisocitrate lyase